MYILSVDTSSYTPCNSDCFHQAQLEINDRRIRRGTIRDDFSETTAPAEEFNEDIRSTLMIPCSLCSLYLYFILHLIHFSEYCRELRDIGSDFSNIIL